MAYRPVAHKDAHSTALLHALGALLRRRVCRTILEAPPISRELLVETLAPDPELSAAMDLVRASAPGMLDAIDNALVLLPTRCTHKGGTGHVALTLVNLPVELNCLPVVGLGYVSQPQGSFAELLSRSTRSAVINNARRIPESISEADGWEEWVITLEKRAAIIPAAVEALTRLLTHTETLSALALRAPVIRTLANFMENNDNALPKNVLARLNDIPAARTRGRYEAKLGEDDAKRLSAIETLVGHALLCGQPFKEQAALRNQKVPMIDYVTFLPENIP